MPLHESVTENPAGQPLLWAIQEMREAVVRLVDEQKARGLTRVPFTDAPGPEFGAAFETASKVETPRAEPRPVPVPVTPQPDDPAPYSSPRRGSSARRRSFSKDDPSEPATVNVSLTRPRSALAEPTPPEPAATAGQDGPNRSEDPRQRLDALARLLDKRVKSSQAPTSESPDRSGET